MSKSSLPTFPLDVQMPRWGSSVATIGEAALILQEYLEEHAFRLYEDKETMTLFCLVFINAALRVVDVNSMVKAQEALRGRISVATGLRFAALPSGLLQAADTIGRLSPEKLKPFIKEHELCLTIE